MHFHLTFSRCDLRLVHRTWLFDPKQVAQVNLRVNVVWDLAFVEEAREVGFHFGSSADPHAQGKEATQVFLHEGKMVSVQTPLPGLLGPLAFLQSGGVRVVAKQVSGHTFPHCKRAWAVGEGASVFEELQVHFANVMLQVKGRREVGLAVVPGTHQHRLMGSVDPFVPPQSIQFLKHLLTHLACKCCWVFDQMLLKFAPGVFKYLAVSMRAAVTCVLLLMGFAGNMGLECGTASILRTLEFRRCFMFL